MQLGLLSSTTILSVVRLLKPNRPVYWGVASSRDLVQLNSTGKLGSPGRSMENADIK